MCVKVINLNRTLATILFLISCSCCGAFNIDTDFPIIYSGSKGSYFGYTTALSKNRWGYLALVGAPKANTTTFPEAVYEPGTLYRCNITRNVAPSQCLEVFLMREGAVEENRRYDNAYRGKKDSMWLGVSLGVRPSTRENFDNDIITCGHLWKNEYHQQLHLVNGVCYVINSNLEGDSVRKLLPLTQRALQYGRDEDGSTEYLHAVGQAGMSVAFSEDGSHLILGAPGIWTWKGSLVIYGWHDARNELYRNPIVPHPPQEVEFTSYFGYSVTTGKFFESNREYIVAGSPRDGYIGKVFIVRQIGNNIRIHQKKRGVQLGEYFGASVLGVNVNGDSFTDLLVGAPQYSFDSGGDEGKVYVYISNGKDLQKKTELTGDRKESARFGVALANIGDVNQDGYFDVAVGAPYEDKSGAVYIYHGSSSGLKSNYAQKIEASTLNTRLSGFGIHISRGMDVDENGYPDILIGSYISSNAILLRSRPIILAYPELIFNPKRININQTTCDVSGITLTCVQVDACLWYTGKHVPTSLEFRFTVSIQEPTRRAFFTEKRSRNTEQIMFLDIEKKICSQFPLYLNEDVKDAITPISVQFTHELISPAGFKKRFNETFPIYHPLILTNISAEIPFHTGCGKDDECHADLIVSATRIEPEKDRLITLGTFSTITVQITVKSVKEPAYMSELLITLPPELPTIKYDFVCDVGNQQNNVSLVCNLGNPLRNGSQVDINIKLDATKIPPHTKYLEILCKATTLSTETNPDDNSEIVPLHLETKADIGITGVSSDIQILYDGKKGDSSVISHTYTVRNHGPSPLKNITIFLNIPNKFLKSNEKKQFVLLKAIEKDSGSRLSIPVVCDDAFLNLTNVEINSKNKPKGDHDLSVEDNIDFPNLYPSNDSTEEPSKLIRRSSDVLPQAVIQKEDIVTNTTSTKARGYFAINCDRPDIECITLRCYATTFNSPRKFAQISVGFQLDYTVLDDYLDSWYQAEFATTGYISISDATVVQIHEHPDSFQVKTMILHEGPPPQEKLASWIIFVSVGVGILLLIIILIILIKIGFFKRKEKDMMKEMLCDKDKGEENPQPIDDSDVLTQ